MVKLLTCGRQKYSFPLQENEILAKNDKKVYILKCSPHLDDFNGIYEPFKFIMSMKRVADNKDVTFEIKYATETKGHIEPKSQTIIQEYEERSPTPSPSVLVSASPSPTLSPSPSTSPSSSVKN